MTTSSCNRWNNQSKVKITQFSRSINQVLSISWNLINLSMIISQIIVKSLPQISKSKKLLKKCQRSQFLKINRNLWITKKINRRLTNKLSTSHPISQTVSYLSLKSQRNNISLKSQKDYLSLKSQKNNISLKSRKNHLSLKSQKNQQNKLLSQFIKS